MRSTWRTWALTIGGALAAFGLLGSAIVANASTPQWAAPQGCPRHDRDQKQPLRTGTDAAMQAVKGQAGDSGVSASVSVTIGYVTFGQRLRRLDPVAGGHVVRLRLDVVAAGGTYDPDLRIDVDGARLLSCSLHELTPGRVAHVVLRVWVPSKAQGRSVRVTATVRLRTNARGDVRPFRETYEVPIPLRKS